jgi:hypothetical protein
MKQLTKAEQEANLKRWEQDWIARYRRRCAEENAQITYCPSCKGLGEINTCTGNYPSSGEDMRICLCFATCRRYACPACGGSGRG